MTNAIDIINERKIIKDSNNTEYINIYQYNLSHIYTPSEGGTGITNYTIGDLLTATSATTLSVLSDIATENVLLSAGVNTPPIYGKVNLATTVDNVLPIANGGTNISSYTTGDLLYASGTDILGSLASVATGNVLLSGGVGVIPSYGKVNLTSMITGILPVANGGTNLTTYTTGNLIYASGATTLAKLADVAIGSVLLSNGVGVAPSYGKVNLTTAVNNILPIANGGIGVSDLPLGLLISDGSVISSIGIGSAYNIIGYNSGSVSFMPSAFLRSITSTSSSSTVVCGSFIPDDNTVPINSEGTQILFITYSALVANSTLIIQVFVNVSCNSALNIILALHRSGISGAIAVGYVNTGAGVGNGAIIARYIPPNTSSGSYSVRCGTASATAYMNAAADGNVRFNGTLTSRMVITEYTTN
jgi:hypothetical protein